MYAPNDEELYVGGDADVPGPAKKNDVTSIISLASYQKFGEWQDRLTRGQVRQIVSVHHAQMRRFGFPTDDLKPLAGL